MKRKLLAVLLILALVTCVLPLTVTAAAVEDLGTYSWAGEWKTNWGDMVLTQNGANVSGTYTYDQGKISGTISGNTLTGTWSEAPSYAPPNDAGEVEFVMSADGQSFTGKWRYGSEGDWGGWDGGTRVGAVIPQTPAKASSWAQTDIDKADGYGLIPASLKGADLTKPITREEFTEITLVLYEKSTGVKTTPFSPNPFTDTANPKILKAYNVGIAKGISATTYEPKALINREQVAAILLRTIKRMAPHGDYSTAGAPTFTDQKDVSDWALESVLVISRLGIIRGVDGKFMPRATTTAQQAAGYSNTTREQAVLMSLRAFENLDTIKASTPPAAPPPAAPAGASVVGTWTLGALSGGQFNAATGKYEGGATGLGMVYTFKPDGTYTALAIWSEAIWLTGKYSVKNDVLTLTERAAEESNDGGKTWGAKETLPNATAYFIAGTDEAGKYLLLGEEGATPPLVEKKNALKYLNS
ncbi:MAG: S-layer homology domain-containing protein [Clostridia bacterium]|jgi:hypothetical protein|nr:S-layer homology domain-containing protein [Clostridia bacterium]